MKDKKAIKLMEYLGFSNIDIQIYFKLLETGAINANELHKATKIPRATIYRHLNELVEKQIISNVIIKSKSKYQAKNPNILMNYLNSKKIKLETTLNKTNEFHNDFSSIIGNLNKLVDINKNDETAVEIKIYKGKNEVWSLYEKSFESDLFYSFANYDKYYEIFPNSKNVWDKIYDLNPKRKVFDIVTKTKLSEQIKSKTNKNHNIKFFNGDKFNADYLIFDDNFAIIYLNKKNLIATLIKSKHLSQSFKTLHLSLWDLLPEN